MIEKRTRKSVRTAVVLAAVVLAALLLLVFVPVAIESWYVRLLRSPDELQVLEAIEKLGDLRSSAAVPELLRLRATATSELFHRAGDALWSIGGRAVHPCLRVLREGPPESVRPAISLLGRLGARSRAAVDRLVSLSEHEEAQIRSDAIWALAKIAPQDRRTVASAVRAHRDRSWKVRSRATWALGCVRPGLLESHLEDLMTGGGDHERSLARAVRGSLAPETPRSR